MKNRFASPDLGVSRFRGGEDQEIDIRRVRRLGRRGEHRRVARAARMRASCLNCRKDQEIDIRRGRDVGRQRVFRRNRRIRVVSPLTLIEIEARTRWHGASQPGERRSRRRHFENRCFCLVEIGATVVAIARAYAIDSVTPRAKLLAQQITAFVAVLRVGGIGVLTDAATEAIKDPPRQ
jgi:hypothetical protein